MKLLPREVRQMTPGELIDCITARVWVAQARARTSGPRPPMTDAARAAQVAKLAAFVAAKQGRPSPTGA